jgi:hypothetical protein
MEAFVPNPAHFVNGQGIRVREITATSVSLQFSLHSATEQVVESQHVVLGPEGIRLFPHVIRYADPEEIDAMAAHAGLRLRERWAGWHAQQFSADAGRHISFYDLASA